MGLLTSLLSNESTDTIKEMIHKMFPNIVDDLVAQFLKNFAIILVQQLVRRLIESGDFFRSW